MLVKKNTLLTAAIALALTACGSSYTPPTNSGKAVDGYLKDSTVTCVGTGATTKTGATGDFTFSPACDGAVTVTGGTNIDTGFPFTGKLKAPAGSTIVSPLTTLVAGLNATQTAALLVSLGLPAGTDLTKTDPADGQHLALQKATLAVQQIIQKMANSFGTLLNSTDISGLYATIATSVATELTKVGAAPLLSSTGVVNTALLSTVATSAVTAVGAQTTITTTNLAALADQIGVQAQQFMQATSTADLANVTTTLQNPAAAPIDTTAAAKYLALKGDAISINGTLTTAGTPYTLAQFATGVSLSDFSTIGLEFDVSTTPVVDTTVALFLEATEVGGAARQLQVMIDKVAIKLTNGQLSVVPASTAKVFVHGHTTNGTDINLTLNDLTFKPLTVTSTNKINLNLDVIIDKMIASSANTTGIKFNNVKGGTFATKIVVADLNIRHADGAALNTYSVAVSGSSVATNITGHGIAGQLTIAP